MTHRPCSQWWSTPCVIRAQQDDKVATLCYVLDKCLYAADRQELSQDQRDVIDAWFFSRVCLLDPRDRK